MNATRVLKDHIKQLTDYLEPFLPLANFHMVDYFINNAFVKYIPIKIQEDIQKIGYKEAVSCIFNDNYTDLPNLGIFNDKSKKFTLKNIKICLKIDDLQEKLQSLGCSDPTRLKLDIFMTSKKSHEVDILSYIAAALSNISGTTHLIDIGDGKGYLSSMLALHHKIPVLGIDASAINTNGAVTRVKKLSRVWNAVSSPQKEVKSKEQVTSDLYKQVTKFVDSSIDFVELVSDIFLEKPDGLGIVGLHTCGNLAATSLRVFAANLSIKTICNVGCCYHLLSERFEDDRYNVGNEEDRGFPISNYLISERYKIGRAGRMIAAQSMERILDKRELPKDTIFYRALLEVILEKRFNSLDPDKRHVGKIRRKCENFVQYAREAFKKLKVSCADVSDAELEELFQLYKQKEYELYIFYLIRNMLSPIIESIILMDRLLYLYELGIENAYLVQVFDPVVSPRCYGLVGIK
uniref:Methyltransferase-like protein 25 n=1 Tax=Diabrotica virgifera virgifera TaxID=50390 RepID=A0A6P7G621_DIAVI